MTEMSDIKNIPVKKEKTNVDVKKPKLPVGFLIALLLLSIGTAVYFWKDAQEARQSSPEQVAAKNQEETQRIIGALNGLIVNDSEAEPTVARVEEPELLRDANPDFYKNVQVGDHLVLYPQRAIIYRESENRIINIAPIIDRSDFQTSDTDSAGSSSP